jgi:HK97 family phage major capsid protein
MTTTLKSNMFIPQILEDVLHQGFAGQIALYGTEAAAVVPSLPEEKRGGDTVTIPRFNALAAAQIVADGDPLVPQVLSMDSETATVFQVGNAVTMTKWAQIAAAFADPYAEAGRQILATITRAWDQKLIDVAVAATGLPAAQKISIWSATTPKTIDYPTFVDAKMSFGDEQADVAAVVVHSSVLANMYKLTDSYGRPLLIDAASKGGLPTFLGIPTIVSDRMPKDMTDPNHPKYTSVVIKKSALVLWANGKPQINEFRDPLTNSDVLAWFAYFAAYRYPTMDGLSKPGVVTIASNG